jgi:hypothetical protein
MQRSRSFRLFLLSSSCLSSLAVPGHLAAEATDFAQANAHDSSASTPSTKQLLSKTLTLEGGKVWTDTGISLEPGQRVFVAAEGKLRYADAKSDNGPDGLARDFKDLIRILPFNAAGRGALIGKIGDPDIAQPFLIGASKDTTAPVSGKLSIGINQVTSDTGDGSYTVTVTV